MKIGTKLLVGFGIMVVLLLGIGVVSLVENIRTGEVTKAQQEEIVPDMLLYADLHRETVEVHLGAIKYITGGEAEARQESLTDLEELVEHAEKKVEMAEEIEPEEVEHAQAMLAAIQEFGTANEKVLDMKTRGATIDELVAFEERTYHPAFEKLVALVEEGTERELEEFGESAEVADTARLVSMILIIVVGIVAVVVGVVLAILMGRGISRPIVQLTNLADEISTGNVSRSIVIESKDEIGDLSTAFERMRISLQKTLERLEKVGLK